MNHFESKIFDEFLARGVNKKDREHGETPLMIACRIGTVSLVSNLLSQGAEVNNRDNRGRNAIMSALYVGNRSDDDVYNLCVLLLDAGCDVNSSDDHGRTPLMWAVSDVFIDKPLLPIVKLLLDRGGSINAVDLDGRDALSWSRESDPYSSITQLLENWKAEDE